MNKISSQLISAFAQHLQGFAQPFKVMFQNSKKALVTIHYIPFEPVAGAEPFETIASLWLSTSVLPGSEEIDQLNPLLAHADAVVRTMIDEGLEETPVMSDPNKTQGAGNGTYIVTVHGSGSEPMDQILAEIILGLLTLFIQQNQS